MSLLDRAENHFGPLSENVRDRIRAFLADPTHDTWENCYTVIINPNSLRLGTVWQAVRAIDPTFPHQKFPGKPWERLPDTFTVARAIKLALDARKEKKA